MHHFFSRAPWIFAFALVACASSVSVSGFGEKVYYSDSRYVYLLPPRAGTVSVEEEQEISGTFGERTFQAASWIRLNDSTIHVLLFGPMGNTLAELFYAEDSISFSSKWMDAKKVKPEYILADLQFCYYPARTLQRHFESAGFKFAENRNGGTFDRTLSENGKVILKMERSENRISLWNGLRGYSYKIRLGEKK